MPDYMIFRAVVPPGFNLEEYAKRSNEPIRYDTVTVIEAKNEQEAVETLISATGVVTAGFAVCRAKLFSYDSQGSKLGAGGKLVAKSQLQELEASNDDRLAAIEADLDALRNM